VPLHSLVKREADAFSMRRLYASIVETNEKCEGVDFTAVKPRAANSKPLTTQILERRAEPWHRAKPKLFSHGTTFFHRISIRAVLDRRRTIAS
jgi:hypothetical protein